jgi:hypothetical protein
MAINLLSTQTAEERRVLRAFREAINSIRDQAVIQEIVRLLEVGNVDGVIELLQLDAATFEPLEEAIRQAYRQGGLTGAAQIGPIPVAAGTLSLRFNVRSPRAEEWLRNMSSRLITEIVEDQRVMVRERLTDALSRGVNPRQSALDLVGRIDQRTRKRVGGFVGLTQRQAQWVSNAADELANLDSNYFTRELRDKRFDATVRRAIADGKPLKQDQINRITTAMQARAERYRGLTIAQTESVTALRAGQNEAIAQAVELGEVEREFTKKFWDSSGRPNVRETHRQADIQYRDGIPFDEPFIVGGYPLMYPGDPRGPAKEVIRCHCHQIVEIDFGARLARIEGFG